MTSAIVIAMASAADGGPAALLPAGGASPIGRLVAQLRATGVTRVGVVTRPAWVEALTEALPDADADMHVATTLAEALSAVADVAETIQGEVVVADADLYTHGSVLLGLLRDPRTRSGILVGPPTLADGVTPRRGWGVRVERGRVVAASSPFHRTDDITARFLGVIRLDDAARAHLVVVARRLADLVARGMPEAWEAELARKAAAWEGGAGDGGVAVATRTQRALTDATGLLLTGIVRAGVTLRCSYLRDLYWAQPYTRAEADAAARECAEIDEDRVRMNSAVKANDGFFGTFFCSPYTRYIARWADRRGLVPNQVTVFSFALGLSAAACFAVGGRAWSIAGAVLLYFTLAFDCVDGQLARYSKRFTALGAWLDPMFDRGKEYSVYAALAIGGVRTGGDSATLWALAAATMGLQTVKHFLDFSYAAGQHRVLEALPPVDLIVPEDPRTEGRILSPAAGGAPADESGEGQDLSIPAAPHGASARARARRAAVALIGWGRRTNRLPGVVWAKRIIGFPIGERYAAICFTAALASPEAVFVVMLAWNGFSLAYTSAGRVVRSVI